MKNLISKWWFWVIAVILVIVLYGTGIAIIQMRVNTEFTNSKNLNNRTNSEAIENEKYEILILDDNNRVFNLSRYNKIYNLNASILDELEEILNSYNFNNKSGQKKENEIIINDISAKENISYTIKYDISTNELKQISIKSFEKWNEFSNFNVISMKIAELTVLNFNQEQLSEIWNLIKNNKKLNIKIGEWKIQNNPEINTFSIDKIN